MNEIPYQRLLTDKRITHLSDTSYKVYACFNGGIYADDSTTFEICATLANGSTCCDTFQLFLQATALTSDDQYYFSATHSPAKSAVDYKILDSNSALATTIPPVDLTVQVYDDFGNSFQTLHRGIPLSAEGTIPYGDLPLPLNNIVFQWGDRIVTVRVVKVSR